MASTLEPGSTLDFKQKSVMKADTGSAAGFPEPLLPEDSGEQVSERLLAHIAGCATTNMVALADSLGLFKHMAAQTAAQSSQEIADGMGLVERWVRELLHQLASARMVSTTKDAALFWLTTAQADVLAHEEGPEASERFMVGACASLTAAARQLPQLAGCFKSGIGLKYDAHGGAVGCGTCRELAVWTRHHLLDHVKKIPGLHERLEAGASVADVGCGYGVALSLLAGAYPKSAFHGYDISAVALEATRARCAALGNVALFNPENGAGEQLGAGAYDFAITMDAIHDMAAPEPVLAAVRAAMKDDALGYLVVDFQSTGDAARNITEMGDDATVCWGFSVMLCMSSALSERGGRGLGTLGWHPQLAHAMLRDAGFAAVQTLPWQSDLSNNNFYLATV